jgi:hypothetical protein
MYKLTKQNNSIIRLSDNAFIPLVSGNSDNKEYLKWLAEGNSPQPAESVIEIQSRLWEEIKILRDKKKAQGVKVGNYWFHSDDTSRIQHLGLVLLGSNIPANLLWKTMSGAFVEMTPTLAQQIFQQIAYSDTVIFTTAEQHKATMYALQDPTNYDYTVGWPQVYES